MTREEAALLLPYLANGSLSPEERVEVEAVLGREPGLEGELAALKALRRALQAQEVQSPGEFGLARLMREVGRKAPAPQPQRNWWRAVAAVALVVALGQAVYLMQGSGAPDVVLAGGADGPGLIVAFVPGAAVEDIAALVAAQGLQVVGGPSALGLWRLAPDDPDADLAAAEAALKASSLVESVEREAGDGD